jgi:asparagine synthase (glutamine-hydrolysing)
MCGIAGAVDLVPGLEPAEALVATMTDTLRHRGPDDAGLLVDGPVVLGHRRLSIIDLSPAGHQPMPARGDALWITFNGELYNYVELRDELRGLGHEFHTASDTEVLLEAYAAWGTGMLERLNGMFAFAIRDRTRGTVLLVRDRFGVKPLYHTTAAGRLRFASEIKALLVDPEVERRPNDARVLDFLASGLSDHTEQTMFEGVAQLPPGTYLELRPHEPVPAPTTWYRPRPSRTLTRPAGRHLRSLLESAVTLRLRSDVPVGVALSGGMDSSSVLAVASGLRAGERLEPPRSFSARSSDPARDEFRYSESMLRTTGSRNDDVLPTADGLMAELDSLVWHMDEPFHSPSVYGQRTVHELARSNGVIVLLDGQGGDEALSGYHHFHYPALLWSLVRRGRLLRFAREVRARKRRLGVSTVRSLKDVAKLLLASRRPAAGRPAWLAPTPKLDPPPTAGTSLPSHQDYGLAVWPLPAYNHHADRNSMTFSLETRNPFLDVRVVEAARAMRSEDLLHDGFTKWALREGVRDIVPTEIVDRADKQGFTTDEPLWFRDRLSGELASTFASKSLAARGYFDVPALQAGLADHRRGADLAPELWRAYVVERWFRLFVDPEVLEAPAAPASAVPSRASAADNVVRLTRAPRDPSLAPQQSSAAAGR